MQRFGKVCWKRVETLDDAETVRDLRNAGREWFSNSKLITEEDQRSWWSAMMALDPGDFYCILAGDPGVGTWVGYGMLRRLADDRMWVSLAVDPMWHGKGYGAEIYRILAQWGRVYAGIRTDNADSMRAARAAGYLDSAMPVPNVLIQSDWVALRSP